MSLFRTALAVSGISLALATSAFGETIQAFGSAFVVDSSGNAKSVEISERGHAMIMRHAHRLRAGTIVYMSGGHLYMMNSRAMADDMSTHPLW